MDREEVAPTAAIVRRALEGLIRLIADGVADELIAKPVTDTHDEELVTGEE